MTRTEIESIVSEATARALREIAGTYSGKWPEGLYARASAIEAAQIDQVYEQVVEPAPPCPWIVERRSAMESIGLRADSVRRWRLSRANDGTWLQLDLWGDDGPQVTLMDDAARAAARTLGIVPREDAALIAKVRRLGIRWTARAVGRNQAQVCRWLQGRVSLPTEVYEAIRDLPATREETT